MIAILAALLLQAAAGTARPAGSASPVIPQSASERTPDIVVTGRPLDTTQRALAACLVRHCPPNEDIAASLAQANNQTLAGDYYGARQTLIDSRHRNFRYADKFPVEVGELLRATGKASNSVGFTDTAKINQIESFESLARGLPPGDERVLAQRLELGDSFAKRGELDSAVSDYRWVARAARRFHLPAMEGWAMLREVLLYSNVASLEASYAEVARASRKRLLKTTDPALQPYRDAAKEIVIATNAAAPKGPNPMPADARTAPPRLIYNKGIDQAALDAISTSNDRGGSDVVQWADITFHVDPTGAVDNVKIARRSQPAGDGWIKVAQDMLRKRRYTSYPADASPPGIDRTERYTFVYELKTTRGSHMIGRSTVGRIDIVDLTPSDEGKTANHPD